MKTAVAVLALALLAAAQEPEPLPAPYPEGKIAEVGEEIITTGMVMDEIQDLARGLRNTYPEAAAFEAALRKLFDEALISLVRERVVEQEARSRGLTVADAELDARERDGVRALGGGDREKFKELLAQKGLTIAQWREGVKRELLGEKVLADRIDWAGTYVAPEEVTRYYRDHPEEFRRRERVKARVLTVLAASEAARGRAQRLAESLRRQLDAGADFAVLNRWTDGGPQANAAEPEWRERGDFDPALEKAVFEAEKGAVVGPVAGAEAIYIARVEDREAALTESFEDAQQRIQEALGRARRRAAYLKAQKELMRDSFIRIVPAELEAEFRYFLGDPRK